jgi:hypothetical protein
MMAAKSWFFAPLSCSGQKIAADSRDLREILFYFTKNKIVAKMCLRMNQPI